MRRRPTTLAPSLLAVALLLAACAGGDDPRADAPADDPAGAPADDPADAPPACQDVPLIEVPDERYGDDPIYVANEMPTEQVQAWAQDQPGFQTLWIDRERNGWITVAFSSDAEARQAELGERFPDDGVVAVEVDYDLDELRQLQRRLIEELSFDVSSGVDVQRGVVSIGVGVLSDERLEEIAQRFGDEPVCVEGTAPSDAPPEGPQRTEGEGWRLLAAEQDAGEAYRTGIATDDQSYAQLWRDAGLPGDRPDVDLDAEVVLWFGAVYGSGCDDLRLDDVVIDRDAALVHADIVLVDPPAACNDDANPYAFVVAVARDRLPEGPFALQLGADDPPAGVPEERTYVEVDVSEPDAVAGPDDLRRATQEDLGIGDGPTTEPGDVIEPGFPASFQLDVHCGADWLGPLNDRWWHTDAIGAGDVPDAWREVVDDRQQLKLTVTLSTDPPELTATANDHTVTYEPATQDPPECD